MIENPVLRKELLMRLKIRQMPMATVIGIASITLLLLGIIYYYVIVKWIFSDTSQSSGYDAWMLVVGIQAGIIFLIGPSIAANSITQEKEQQTWEMLIFTRLRPSEIIFGKLISRLSTFAIMLALFFPIEFFSWIKAPGHISGTMFFLTYLTMVVCAVFYASFGLFMSWMLKRTIYAIMCSYTFVVGGLIITTSLVSVLLSMIVTELPVEKSPFIWINPIVMMYRAINPRETANSIQLLMFGLVIYVVLTAIVLWRMIDGFRRFAYDR